MQTTQNSKVQKDVYNKTFVPSGLVKRLKSQVLGKMRESSSV